MKVTAIVQARMGSTRLPGKVLKDIAGKTMLSRILSRLRASQSVQEIAVATSTSEDDSAIVNECRKNNVPVFRGNEADVLDRYYQASKSFSPDAVVRITGDCPFIDPQVIDLVVNEFITKKPDYASNTLERTYPRGLDTEVVSIQALEKAWKEAKEPYQRAHVTPYFYQNSKLFRLASIKNETDFSSYRWTVDTQEDFDFTLKAYELFENSTLFTWKDLVKALEKQPHLKDINHSIAQKHLEEG